MMNEPERYQQALSNFQVYLDCGLIAMFVVATGVLIAAFSPLHWIGSEFLASVSGRSGYLFAISMVAAMLISGHQITSIWSERTMPTFLDMSFFCVIHLVAFLASYMVMGILLPIFQSSVVPFVCILFAIASSCICFIRARGS
jgi:uncharacterized membrane protein